MSDKLTVIKQQLETVRPTFEQLNLMGLDFNKEVEFAVQILNKNTYLAGANPESILNSLKNIALTGLSLNPVLKYSYLVPRREKGALQCIADVSYIGLCKILTDTGSVKAIKASVVYSNEPFDIELGSGGFITHKPYFGEGGKGKRLGCYSLATLHDGSYHVHWMYAEDIENIMRRSEAVKAGKGSPWDSDTDEMWKKTVIKQHSKTLPKTDRAVAAANAIALDHDNHGIDFDKEQKQKAEHQPQPISLDTLDPENEENLASFNKIKALFESDLLPDKLSNGQVDVKEVIENLFVEFSEGNLTKEKANKWYVYIKAQVDYYKKNPISKEEDEDGF